jgi:hypothetical protein
MYVSREALSQLTGITDPEQLAQLEMEVERRAKAAIGYEKQGLSSFDIPKEDQPFTALSWRRPIAGPNTQLGDNLILRAGQDFAREAELEGSYFGLSNVMQALQWGDFDADRAIALINGWVQFGEDGKISYK